MIYNIKSYLLEEGVLDHVKNNIGKYGLAAAGLAAAGSGEFGDDASHFANSAFDAAHHGADNVMQHGTHMVDHYSGATGTAGSNTSPDVSGEHVQTAEEYKQQLAEKAKHDALLKQANGPHTGLDKGTFYNNKISVDNTGHVDSSYDGLTDLSKHGLEGTGLGLAGLGLAGAHRNDKRRMRQSFQNGANSVK